MAGWMAGWLLRSMSLLLVLLLFRCSAFCFPFSSISQCLHTLKELFVGRQQTIKHLRYIAYQQLRYGIVVWSIWGPGPLSLSMRFWSRI